MSVGNANQTNPPEAKRCEFASLDTLITPNSTGMQPKSRVIVFIVCLKTSNTYSAKHQ